MIVVAKTDPRAGAHGISLFVVERGTPGFKRGRRLEKVGLKANDTAELFFDDCRIPADHLLGQENAGFYHLMANLPRERLGIAVAAVASAEHVLAITLEYAKEPAGVRQADRVVPAQPVRARGARHRGDDRPDVPEPVHRRAQRAGGCPSPTRPRRSGGPRNCRTRSRTACLQLHGGYGYMMEYPVAKALMDSRVQTIYGGTTEIMKEIIGRSLGV